MIDFAIRNLPALVTSSRSNDTVTAEARIIEPLIKIAGLSDVKEFTITDKKIDPRNIVSVKRETTESPFAVPVELSVSSVLILRVILYCMAGFIAFWDYRLNEAETVTEKYNLLLWLMRFWILPLLVRGH